MHKYFITTDGTCDLPLTYKDDTEFYVFPLSYKLEDEEGTYDAANTEIVAPFYTKMASGAMPTTAQITPFAFEEKWREILSAGFDIVHISFSSALSGTYNNTIVAQRSLQAEFPDRFIATVDSVSASGGEGLLVYYALQERDNKTAPELEEFLNSFKYTICHYFTVNSLAHLHRGGRVSRMAAIVGTALQLKPLLNVNDKGELIPIDKCMGRKASLAWLAKMTLEKIDISKNKVIFLCDGNAPEEADFVAAKIKAVYPELTIARSYIGPIIGAHCGEGVMAVFFITSDKR